MAIASTSSCSSSSRMRPRGPATRRQYNHGLPLMPPLNPTALSLVKALINLSQEVVSSSIASSCPCQKRNIAVMTRRVKILLMLFEEIRDAGPILPPSALLCFSELHVVIQRVKLLMDDCAESSRIWLLMEHQRLSAAFHDLTQEMAAALEILPLSLLDVSCDVREQVELMRAQAKKAKLYVDPSEAELWTEVQSVMAAFEKKETPDAARLARIFGRLELKDAMDCQREVERMQEEVEEEEGGPKARLMRVCFNDMVSFVRYCKCVLYGATEMETTEEATEDQFTAEEELDDEEVKVPDDFRCPISLELMGDPVIVSTGQTYERAAISTWIESGHQTCPKSGQRLAHKTLVPNYALRNVIRQWCLRHNVRLKPPEPPIRASDIASPPTAAAMEATKLTAEFLLRELPAAAPDARRHIAGELRLLAKSGSNNRKLVAEAGAIPALIPLLTSGDARTQEHAVTAILNLSIYPPNKALIVEAGAVEPLIGLVQAGGSGSEAARENAAAALFSLSHVTDYAALLGGRPEAIEGLLDLLRGGSPRGRRDAASALFNMAVYHPNRPALVAAGAVSALTDSLSPSGASLTDETLAVLAVLAGCPEGRLALAARPDALANLVALLRTASPKGKENAASVLLQLCRHGGDPFLQGLLCDHPCVLPCLRSLLSTGTPRATRKATSLLRIFHRFSSHQRTIASDLQQQHHHHHQHQHQHDATTLAY